MHPVARRLEGGIAELLARFAYDLVDVQYLHAHGSWALRVFIERSQTPRFAPYGGGPLPTGAVSHTDCENVSRILSAWLDEQDAIPHSYRLEVSSPGLDRILKRAADYERFQGRLCRLRTREPVAGSRAHRGRISSVDSRNVVLTVEGTGRALPIPLEIVERANLEPELTFGRPRERNR